MKKAMITIEVLISLMILMIVIASSTSAVKFFHMAGAKKQNYEDLYITVLSIKDKLAPSLCKTTMNSRGKLNGYNYSATCKKEKSLREYKPAFDIGDPSGNIGENIINLYQVNLTLTKEKQKKNYTYYVNTIQKSPQ